MHAQSFFFVLLIIVFSSQIPPSTPQPSTISSLDTTIASSAFHALTKRHSDIFYHVPLPANLSGIKASVIRVRSATLWKRGLNHYPFHIPPQTVSVPYVKRIAVVYQDLGDLSPSYYNVPGYTFAGPVYGFLVYDASNASSNGVNVTQLDLRVAMGKDIRVIFSRVDSTMKCVRFGSDRVGNVGDGNECYTGGTGHFAIVVPTKGEERGGGRWWIWVVGIVGGVLVVLGLVGDGILRLVWRRKRKKMEVHAEMGEVLGSVMVGKMKMPFADKHVRTQPALEEKDAPD